jgi:hypothetical protein
VVRFQHVDGLRRAVADVEDEQEDHSSSSSLVNAD